MKWIEIDKDNLPEGEVLAANFHKGNFAYGKYLLGYLEKDEKDIWCECQCEILQDPTHYIDPENIEMP